MLTKYAFIAQYRSEYTIREVCRALKVAGSGFYAFLKQEPSARAIEDETLKQLIR